MISNRTSKFIKSLQLKKFRNLEKKFVVEGQKNVLELLNSDFKVNNLYATERFVKRNKELIHAFQPILEVVSSSDLEKVGTFKTNDAALAVVDIPDIPDLKIIQSSVLAFDRIKDPGNLGTIIRIADWYGFEEIVCSPDSVDCFNAKVISSTMGSFTRVKVHYQDISHLLRAADHSYGATLGGEDLHHIVFDEPAVLLFGNESQGIDQDLLNCVNEKVKIKGLGQAESLNVAVSTAIFCDNFRRLTK